MTGQEDVVAVVVVAVVEVAVAVVIVGESVSWLVSCSLD